MGLASVLPFLAMMKQQQGLPPGPGDISANVNAPSQVAALQNPPAPPPQAPSDPGPDMSIGAPQIPPQPAPDPLKDLAQTPPSETQAPKYKEPKGALLQRLLQGGLQGALSGQAANAQTYAATGRNAGWGAGAAAGYTGALPFQRAMQGQELTHAGLQNQQLIQMLPFLRAQQFANLGKTQAEAQNLGAQAGKAQAETAAIPAETALKQAQTLAAKYKEQNGILTDLSTGKPLTPDASGMVTVPADIAGAMGVQPGTRLPAKQITDARSAYYGHLMGSDPSIVAQIGPPPVNDRNSLVAWGKQAEAIKTREASAPRIEMMLNRPTQVMDPNNPGNITYVPAAQAMQGMSAPTSAPAVTARETARELAPGGAVGKQTQAFNTSIQHADLLVNAVTKLNNGDVQGLNSLKNSFANQFGSSGPITTQAIADAYTREVTKMLSAGHLTDSEIGTIGKTLDPQRQSPAQMLGVLNAYKALASSKLNVLQKGVQSGLQGKADFSGIQQHVIQIGNQQYQYKGQGPTDDLRNYDPIK